MSPLIGFRLDARERARTTEKALAGACGEAIRALEAALAPGGAIAAVLVEHTWARALADAIAQTGGTPLSGGFVGSRDARGPHLRAGGVRRRQLTGRVVTVGPA